MRKVLYLLILLVTFGSTANSQVFVTHTSGTVIYGGVAVTVTPIGSPATTTPICGLAPYYIGINGASGYEYKFNPAITHVRARFYELNSNDSIQFTTGATQTPLVLTAANLSNYTGTCGAATTSYITPGGRLSSTSTQVSAIHAGAQIDYQNSPGTIDEMRIYQTTLNSAGVIMDFWFKRDTCGQTFNAWPDTPICRGRTLKLVADSFPNTTYAWTTTSGTGTWTSGVRCPSRTPANLFMNGSYTVTATRGICTYTKTFTVNVDNIPFKPTVSQDGPVCPQLNDTLRMNTNIPGGGTFEWRGPGGQTFSTTNNFLPLNQITPANAGAWYMFALTTNGCSSDTTNFTVGINNPVTAQFKVDSSFGCTSDTVNFTDQSTGNTSPNNWTFGDGNSSTAKSPTHIYTAQGTFNIRLIASNGQCHDTDFHTVALVHPLSAAFTVDDDSICQGTLITLTNTTTVTPGTVPIYTWDYDNGDTGKTFDDVYTFVRPGAYNVQLYITDYLGCNDTAKQLVIVDSVGSIDFTASSESICLGSAIDFKGTYSPQGNTGITWDFDDGVIIPFIIDVRHVYEKPKTSYSVKLDATYRICPDVSKTYDIDVNPFPIVDLGKDTAICPNGVAVRLRDRINESNADAKWLWNTPTKDVTAATLIRHPGIYAVTVDIKGCKTTDSVEVKKNCYVNIPNIFTPNGDGNNDYFLPRQLLSSSVTKFDMKIFNRWGEIIFETDATDGRGWDGRVNGEIQPTGVYIYLMNVRFANGTNENYQGNITLLR